MAATSEPIGKSGGPGFRYVVALDESEFASWAFNLATSQMNKKTDELVLLCIAKLLSTGYGYSDAIHDAQLAEEKCCKRLVRRYGLKAKSLGIVNFKLVLSYGTDIGEAIVHYLTENSSDFLLIGRRSMGSFKRLFLGSTSKHVIENAPCTVTVIKEPFGPEEVHVSKNAVKAAEEAERQERIREQEQREARDRRESEWLSKLNQHITVEAEEEERARRIAEEKERELEALKAE
jgi:nucleotide-binding universal stress UspA family protein